MALGGDKYILISENEYKLLIRKRKTNKNKKKLKPKKTTSSSKNILDLDNYLNANSEFTHSEHLFLDNKKKKLPLSRQYNFDINKTPNLTKNDNIFSLNNYKKKDSILSKSKIDEKSTQTIDTINDFTFFLPLNNNDNKRKCKDSFEDINNSNKPNESLLNILFPELDLLPSNSTKKEETLDLRPNRTSHMEGEPINESIETLDDLFLLDDNYCKLYVEDTLWCVDFKSLRKMRPSLEKLHRMVGLDSLKKKIVSQIIFYLQGLDNTNKDMLHTVIEGKPGVGKTELAKILGEIYVSLGILSKGHFRSVKRSDLIGSYLGQTATKTQKVLDEAKGGILFIDEAYSLGNQEGKDIYSKECIDTITSYLTENRQDFVCIIAGYKDQLENCFFNYNQGLKRRFPWVYTIEDYNATQLRSIFEKIVKDHLWKCDIPLGFFNDNYKSFIHFGGDMEILFQKTKMVHSKRCLQLEASKKKHITLDDLKKGFKMFSQNTKPKSNEYGMYS